MPTIGDDFLAQVAVFRGLNAIELDRIATLIEREKFPAGTIIARQGDEAHVMYIIESGRCAISMESGANKEPQIITQLSAGDCLGEMALVDIQPRSATITATEPTVLLSLSNAAFLTIYQINVANYALILNNICREISRRLRIANERWASERNTPEKDGPVS